MGRRPIKYNTLVGQGGSGTGSWTKRVGKLPAKKENLAIALANPANFAELILGFRLYKKQREALELCMPEGCCVSIAAANGAGKTSRIIPALVLWHQTMFPSGKVKCTSGSYTQIEDQIWPAIKAHKDKFPSWQWYETPNITTRHPATGREGFFRGFTTNEPGRAEGDHPDMMTEPGLPDDQAVPLLFIVDEAKTSPVWLRGVLEGRVRPTRLILMSSHGFAEGWFYESQTTLKEKFKCITISADDCPHITKEEKDAIRHDWIGYPEFADSILGFGFLPLVQDAAINGKALDELLANPPKARPGEKHLACDFAWSGSGDENVAALRTGNVVTLEDCFHCDHLEASPKNPSAGIVERFISIFIRLGFSQGDVGSISGDEGGGGKLVMDALDARGWYLNRINNGGTPSNEHYHNTAAEMWFEFGKHVVQKTFVLPNDRMLRGQMLNRKQVVNRRGKLQLETKDDMKKRGVPSPDRADACIMACAPRGGFADRPVDWAVAVKVGEYQTAQELGEKNADELFPEPCYD